MQVAIICEISNNKPIGIIGKNNQNIGYISNDKSLDENLDYIIDKNIIELSYLETLDNNFLIRNQKFDIHSNEYFIALNYILPERFKILGLTTYEENNEFENSLKNIFNALMEESK